jgi:hypothetical protein
MKKSVYRQLKDAYTEDNLNRITAALLELYRLKQHGKLRTIARRISDIVAVDDSKISKCFSQLIVLYHPDRGELHRREIDALHAAGRDRDLRRFSHILLLDDIDRIPSPPSAPDIVDYTPEYSYETGEDFVHTTSEFDEETFEDTQYEANEEEFDNSFFHLFKMKTYGTLTIEMPSYYLRDLDEIEMADCAMTSLDGIEHCLNVTTVDISDNELTDISELQSLGRVIELYAARNQIGYIDALSNLTRLRIADLSMNNIDDVSPLFHLDHLELVNIVGNPVPRKQVERLKSLGCTVLC